jgi:hypothetical protein
MLCFNSLLPGVVPAFVQLALKRMWLKINESTPWIAKSN